jgi:hypothetical protein
MHVMTPVRFKLFEPQIHLGVRFLRPKFKISSDNPWQELPGASSNLAFRKAQAKKSEVQRIYRPCLFKKSIPEAGWKDY